MDAPVGSGAANTAPPVASAAVLQPATMAVPPCHVVAQSPAVAPIPPEAQADAMFDAGMLLVLPGQHSADGSFSSSSYRLVKQLGQGGVVDMCELLESDGGGTGRFVAVKRCSLLDKRSALTALRELQMHRAASSDAALQSCCVRCFGVHGCWEGPGVELAAGVFWPQTLCFVLEEGLSTLAEWCQARLTEPVKRTAGYVSMVMPLGELARSAAQALRLLDTIHSAGYAHGDIKATNILLTRGAGVPPKLMDFGSCRPLNQVTTTELWHSTLSHTAAVLLQHVEDEGKSLDAIAAEKDTQDAVKQLVQRVKQQPYMLDAHAVGIMLLKLYYPDVLGVGEDGRMQAWFPAELRAFVRRCLVYSKEPRCPTAKELLADPFLAKYGREGA